MRPFLPSWCCLALLLFLPAHSQAQESDVRALVLKVVRDVARRAPAAAWTRAVPLDEITSGHEVQTADQSLAMLKFADATKLIVRENSLMRLQGKMDAGRIADRDVQVTRGNIAFSVEKQPQESFRFSSPMAVASVRGTKGAFVSSDTLALFILREGHGVLTNPVSGDSVVVTQGQTGVARPDGSLILRRSTAHEQELAVDTLPSRRRRQLRIPGSDRNGRRQTLILEWEE